MLAGREEVLEIRTVVFGKSLSLIVCNSRFRKY
jgi:hypothetical protein